MSRRGGTQEDAEFLLVIVWGALRRVAGAAELHQRILSIGALPVEEKRVCYVDVFGRRDSFVLRFESADEASETQLRGVRTEMASLEKFNYWSFEWLTRANGALSCNRGRILDKFHIKIKSKMTNERIVCTKGVLQGKFPLAVPAP